MAVSTLYAWQCSRRNLRRWTRLCTFLLDTEELKRDSPVDIWKKCFSGRSKATYMCSKCPWGANLWPRLPTLCPIKSLVQIPYNLVYYHQMAKDDFNLFDWSVQLTVSSNNLQEFYWLNIAPISLLKYPYQFTSK